MKTHHHIAVLALSAVAALQFSATSRAQGSYVSFSGGTYTQNFDSLPYTPGADVNTSNPVTLNSVVYTLNGGTYTSNSSTAGTFDFAAAVDSSGTPSTTGTGGFGLSSTMSGWYGGDTVGLKAGAQSGGQTTGGIISFGTSGGTNDANRSLGVLSTSTSGVSFFGLKLVNTTGSTINQITFAFTGELWHQQTAANNLNYGYYVDSNTSDTLPTLTSSSVPTTGPGTQVGDVSFATGTKSGTGTNSTGPLATEAGGATNLSLSATPWTNGSALWLVFEQSNSAGSAQGISIDNLTFSVPEPGTYALVAIGVVSVGLLGRSRKKAV